ncbi:hypothetical protein AB0E18_29110, partial [Streptomyces sp. NPDC047968]
RPDGINHTVKDGVRRGFFGYDYRDLQKDPDTRAGAPLLATARSAHRGGSGGLLLHEELLPQLGQGPR